MAGLADNMRLNQMVRWFKGSEPHCKESPITLECTLEQLNGGTKHNSNSKNFYIFSCYE